MPHANHMKVHIQVGINPSYSLCLLTYVANFFVSSPQEDLHLNYLVCLKTLVTNFSWVLPTPN